MLKTILLAAIVGLGLGVGRADVQQRAYAPTDGALRGWFPAMAKHAPLASRAVVRAIHNVKGDLLGWVFSTDQLEPVVRGKRGEIGVWVALGRDGKIRGIQVGRHREDKKWFDRIRPPFYQAFEGKPAGGGGGKPDAVTSATRSSRAMIDDVFGACRTVLALPEVRAVFENPVTEE
jgi:hypothetical protein